MFNLLIMLYIFLKFLSNFNDQILRVHFIVFNLKVIYLQLLIVILNHSLNFLILYLYQLVFLVSINLKVNISLLR